MAKIITIYADMHSIILPKQFFSQQFKNAPKVLANVTDIETLPGAFPLQTEPYPQDLPPKDHNLIWPW